MTISLPYILASKDVLWFSINIKPGLNLSLKELWRLAAFVSGHCVKHFVCFYITVCNLGLYIYFFFSW